MFQTIILTTTKIVKRIVKFTNVDVKQGKFLAHLTILYRRRSVKCKKLFIKFGSSGESELGPFISSSSPFRIFKIEEELEYMYLE